VGGTSITARKATGEPIKIGFVNNEGGAFSVPELRIGSEVATGYVNNTLGGVNGRPLEVVRCAADGSPEKSIDCANKFVEAKVAVVVQGVDLGGDALLPILGAAKVPFVGHVQFGPKQMFDPNAYFFGAAALAYGAAALKFYAGEGVGSISWFLPDEPSSHAFTDTVLRPVADKLGIEYKSIYYSAAKPNWPVLAATVASDPPDVSGSIVGTDAQCASFVRALRGVGYRGRILAASCTGLHKAVGAQAAHVDIDFDHWSQSDPRSAPPWKQQEIADYVGAMKAAGHGKLVPGNAVLAFSDTLTLVKILSTIHGPIDGGSVAAALRATKGIDSFLGPPITCDHGWNGNSACHTGVLFYSYERNGSLTARTPNFVDISELAS
jgi:branched-chain amino acid transport system substrate-binding protein